MKNKKEWLYQNGYSKNLMKIKLKDIYIPTPLKQIAPENFK